MSPTDLERLRLLLERVNPPAGVGTVRLPCDDVNPHRSHGLVMVTSNCDPQPMALYAESMADAEDVFELLQMVHGMYREAMGRANLSGT